MQYGVSVWASLVLSTNWPNSSLHEIVLPQEIVSATMILLSERIYSVHIAPAQNLAEMQA